MKNVPLNNIVLDSNLIKLKIDVDAFCLSKLDKDIPGIRQKIIYPFQNLPRPLDTLTRLSAAKRRRDTLVNVGDVLCKKVSLFNFNSNSTVIIQKRIIEQIILEPSYGILKVRLYFGIS